MKNLINLLAYLALGACIGFIIDKFIFDSNWVKYVGLIVGLIFSILSIKELDAQFYTVFAPFNNFKEVAKPGFGIFWMGFKDSYFIKYTKGVFNCITTLEVEYKKGKKEWDSNDLHIEHVNKKKLFDYKMKILRTITLQIKKESASIRKFYIKSAEKSLVVDKINEEKMPWLKNVTADIDSTIELISLAYGFAWIKAHADWDLITLKKASKSAIEVLKIKYPNKDFHDSSDTIKETLERFGLNLVSLNIDVSLSEKMDIAIEKQIIAEEEHTARIIQANTKSTETKIQAKADRERIKLEGQGKAAAEKAVATATKQVFVATYRDYIKEFTENGNIPVTEEIRKSATHQAALTANQYATEKLLTFGNLDGTALAGALERIFALISDTFGDKKKTA